MQAKSKLVAEKIHLVEFRLLKGHIDSPFEFNYEDIREHSFDVELEIGFNLADKMLKAEIRFKISTCSNDENATEASGDFILAYIFHIENMEELVHENDKGLTIDIGLGNAIASISYSTSRGILLTRFQGTALRNFILPVMNPNHLLKKND